MRILFALSMTLHYGVISTTRASSSLSTMNVETLRSLGMSNSEIESILGKENFNQNDDDNVKFSLPSTGLEMEEDFYSYDEYDDTEEDDETDDIEIDESQLEAFDGRKETLVETNGSDEATNVSLKEKENDVKEEWWKDPFANFEGDDVPEKKDHDNDVESGHQDMLTFKDENTPSPIENVSDIVQDNTLDLKLEDELLEDISDAFSEYSYDNDEEEGDRKEDMSIETVQEVAKTRTSVDAAPDSDTSTEMTSSDSKGNVSAITLAALPKIGSALVGSPMAVQAFAALALGNIAFSVLKKSKKKEKLDDVVDSAIKENQPVKDEDSIYEDLDYDYNDDFAFGKPVPSRTEELEVSDKNNDPNDDRIAKKTKEKSKNKKKWGQKEEDSESTAKNNVKPITKRNGFGFRGRRNSSFEIKQLLEEIAEMKERAVVVEQSRDLLEKDVDRTMNQLKEAQRELREVTQTNNYLKNQLADNKRILERAVNAERQKLNNEMSKLREQMVQILERERRIMRAQLMKSSAEVRSLIENSIAEEDEYEYIEEEVDEE